MRILIALFLLLTACCSTAQVKNAFAMIQYDSVMLYCYTNGWNNIVDDSGRLEKSVNQRIHITESMVRVLNKKLSATASYGNDLVGCFSPHMGFVWYKNGHVVGYISVCLQCWQFYADLPINNYDHSYHSLSTSFFKFFNNIRLHYGFPEYTEPIYNNFPPAELITTPK